MSSGSLSRIVLLGSQIVPASSEILVDTSTTNN